MRLPTAIAIGTLAFAGIVALGTRMLPGRSDLLDPDDHCEEFGTCEFVDNLSSSLLQTEGSPVPEAPPLGADVCRNAGYLCFGLSGRPDHRVMRWADGTREIRIRITGPEFEDASTERALQRAAEQGVLTWQGTPFPIRILRGGQGDADFEIRWARSLGGNQLGQTHTEWFRQSDESGMRVSALALVTRSPFNQGFMLEAEQVRLTAAHEMGHALGLPHSDDPRDVMYPTNGAARISSADFATMNALYRLPNGARIDLAGAGY